MKQRYIQESGSEFDEASDIAIRLKVLAGEIFSLQTNLEWVKRQVFPETASGEHLDRLSAQRGLTRREATKATGSLTFSINEVRDDPVVIPAGTVVSTGGERPVRVYTVQNAEIPVNSYSVSVPCEAEQAGYRGNISARSATVPVNVPSVIDSVINNSVFKGGADEESDAALRERLRDSYVSHPNGMNAAYYIMLATSVDGVSKAGVTGKQRGVGTVNVFVANGESGVDAATLSRVQAVLNEARELNVDVRAYSADSQAFDVSVSVKPREGYENAEIIAKCTDAINQCLAAVPMGGKLYLSALGKYLLDTGCITNYEFQAEMTDYTLPASRFFVAGDLNIEVV